MNSKKINMRSILNALSNNEISIKEISDDMNITPAELKKYISKQNEQVFQLFIDGGARGNPGESGIGIVIQHKNKKKGFYYYTGFSTNNEAEYRALIKALKIALSKEIKNLKIYSDSELLCNQMNGLYKIKSSSLMELYKEAKILVNKTKNFSISYIPRNKNKEADKLVNIAIDSKKNGEIDLAVAGH